MRVLSVLVFLFCCAGGIGNEITERLRNLCSSHPCHHFAICTNNGRDFTCKCKEGYYGDGYFCGRINHCDGRCHQQAKCLMRHGRHRCVCNDGYVGSGFGCKKESLVCQRHLCHAQADCDASKQRKCSCKPGYCGDGRFCSRDKCFQNSCHGEAICIPHENGCGYECRCKPGFTGGGLDCTTDFTHNSCEVNDCHSMATCYSDLFGGYSCRCKDGFCGNGKYCTKDKCRFHNCHPNAMCHPEQSRCGFYCRCNEGYNGDGRTCTRDKCHGNRCHRDAICQPHDYDDGYSCTCNKGYNGNGYQCIPIVSAPRELPRHLCETCHKYATCFVAYDENSYSCRCKEGYCGNGNVCRSETKMCSYPRCPVYAECVVNKLTCIPRCKCTATYIGDGCD
ncbi:uncharacterized protein LOC143465192 isoform X1 [Clavelina lepadiformis]|uniref:uncharacterized protein LOC143465192 isoform X1 n=1 Tax=Clavelina lepadiformis TaxID=159417 RepID=UPI0040411B15